MTFGHLVHWAEVIVNYEPLWLIVLFGISSYLMFFAGRIKRPSPSTQRSQLGRPKRMK